MNSRRLNKEKLSCSSYHALYFKDDRDVGGKTMSPTTAAMNIQAKETNSRLERSGFKLDSKEEEGNRLNSALSSFSYDASTTKGTKASGGRGYTNKSTTEKK